MATTLDYRFAPTPAAFQRVVDLTSGVVVGWEVRAREQTASPYQAGEMLGFALAARGDISAGEFLAVRVSPRAIDALRERLIGAGPLDGLAVILVGEASPDALVLAEWARERGALVGCDGAAALLDVATLRPDLLAMSAAGGESKGSRRWHEWLNISARRHSRMGSARSSAPPPCAISASRSRRAPTHPSGPWRPIPRWSPC